jgi:hypothetical protein
LLYGARGDFSAAAARTIRLRDYGFNGNSGLLREPLQ